LGKIYSKTIAHFSTKSILRNQARSTKLVFIVAITLGFILMASTQKASDVQYQIDTKTITTADSLVLRLDGTDLVKTGPAKYITYLRSSADSLGIKNVTSMIQPYNFRITSEASNPSSVPSGGNGYYYSYNSPSYTLIETEVLSQYCRFEDSWFDGISANDALTKLQTIPNATLVSQSMITQGYRVNDKIDIEYPDVGGKTQTISITIVGVFKVFPMQSATSWSGHQLIFDNSTFSNITTTSFSALLFPKNATGPAWTDVKKVLIEFDPTIGVMPLDYYNQYNSYGYYSYDANDLTEATMNFANLESYFLLIIVTVGIGLLMYLSIHEKSHDMGLFRARGVDRKGIFKIQIAEGSLLIFLGILFSLVGILGSYSMVLSLNNPVTNYIRIEHILVIPWLQLGGQFLLSLMLFLGVIIFAVWLELKRSNVTNIAELLRTN
jgi:ABC-type antimicrobial peptide transport system permease subunit